MSINKAREERGDTIYCTPGEQVHQECRTKYCKPEQIVKDLRKKDQAQEGTVLPAQKQVLRSAERPFNFSTHFFFCGKPALVGKKRKTPDVFQVKTVETRDTILAVCRERGDAWAGAVQARMLHVHDLHAADAVYHRVCSSNFRTMKEIPAVHEHEVDLSKKPKIGRPQEKERIDAFLEVARFFEENDDEQITINDLIQRMEINLAGSEHSAYSYPHMQQKLMEHFGDRIIQTEINGKPMLLLSEVRPRQFSMTSIVTEI